jgi:hypothetical protein
MPTIGFLHSADVHVATFDRLVAARAPEATRAGVRSSPVTAAATALEHLR